jgi:hypothetical protein
MKFLEAALSFLFSFSFSLGFSLRLKVSCALVPVGRDVDAHRDSSFFRLC